MMEYDAVEHHHCNDDSNCKDNNELEMVAIFFKALLLLVEAFSLQKTTQLAPYGGPRRHLHLHRGLVHAVVCTFFLFQVIFQIFFELAISHKAAYPAVVRISDTGMENDA